MVKPEVRRQNDILITQKIWSAITVIRQQKQIPNLERISRHLEREYGMKEEDIAHYLQVATEEEMVQQYTAVGCKGSRVGLEQDGYKLPSTEGIKKGDHDWYCFDCHQPGEVVTCSSCWRVYHTACTEEEWQGPSFVCAVCKSSKEKPPIRRKDLSKLLEFTVRRLKEKTRELHSLMPRNEVEQLSYTLLIYHYVDLNAMEERCYQRKYTSLEHFYADCRTILHNTFISYGDVGKMADLARIMIRDCTYDLDEIRQCKDCYFYSNARPPDWFCQPCKPAHTLVYAKQQGFSYWPAKLIKITQLGYDVRFFGGFHQRAIIPETSIRPIETAHKAMNIKKTPGFVKAMDELSRHQVLLERARVMSDNQSTDDDNEDDAEMEQKASIPTRRPSNDIPARRPSNDVSAARRPSNDERVGQKRKRVSLDQEEEVTTPKPRKRQQRDSERVSSTEVRTDKLAATPDDNDMVTSSEDNNAHGTRVAVPTSDSGTQTSKKLLHGKQPSKSVQTDNDMSINSCNCETKYNKFFADFKERLDNDHREELEKALRSQEEKLHKEFEEEQQQQSSHSAASLQREIEKARSQAEDRFRDAHAEEVKALKEAHVEEIKSQEKKHKAEISATKKKQWCYNCEEEAMYHCCWNTSYCSLKCQQDHWHREHKRMCRRKRP